MIRYAVKCADGHVFESWFQNAAAFDTLAAKGHVTCPDCGTSTVEKSLMAPRVTTSEAAKSAETSPEAERGFCSKCGTSLFWRPNGRETLSVSPGAIDNPTGLRMDEHIYVADKGDYYRIADGLPQQDQ